MYGSKLKLIDRFSKYCSTGLEIKALGKRMTTQLCKNNVSIICLTIIICMSHTMQRLSHWYDKLYWQGPDLE